MKMTKTWIFALGTTFAIGIGCGGMEPMEEDFAMESEIETAESSEALFGSDACKNTDIQIRNNFELGNSGREIKVLKVEYYSASEGRWYTEELPNRTIAYGSYRWWWDEDLAHAENDLLTQWRIRFKYRELDGGWSNTTSRIDNTPDDRCHADDNYYLEVD